MKAVQFLAHFFAVDAGGNSYIKYERCGVYPRSDETLSQVAAGFAEEIDVPDDPAPEVPAPADPDAAPGD